MPLGETLNNQTVYVWIYVERRWIRRSCFNIGVRNINNLCYVDATGLIPENANDLQVLVMKVKEHSFFLNGALYPTPV